MEQILRLKASKWRIIIVFYRGKNKTRERMEKK